MNGKRGEVVVWRDMGRASLSLPHCLGGAVLSGTLSESACVIYNIGARDPSF